MHHKVAYGLMHIDLMLLHQPFCDRYGAYRALEEAYKEGKLRAIGVSNFYPDHFIDIASNMEIVPAVNQVETHVFDQQTEAQKIMEEFGTHIMSWGPFAEGRNGLFTNMQLAEIGMKYGKSVAQVALRWLIQRGVIIIPKSTHIERMRQNIEILTSRSPTRIWRLSPRLTQAKAFSLTTTMRKRHVCLWDGGKYEEELRKQSRSVTEAIFSKSLFLNNFALLFHISPIIATFVS